MKNTILFLTSCLLVIPASASAADSKTYSPVGCHSNQDTLTNSFSRVYNSSSTSSISATCPVINDSMGQPITDSWARVYDSSASEDICCTIRSYSQSGPSVVGSWNTTCSSNEGEQVLNTGAVGGSGENRMYSMQCSLPPREDGDRTYLFAYHVQEGN